MKILGLGKSKAVTDDNNSVDTVPHLKSWYEARYDSVLVQRNWLFIFLIVLLGLSIISVIAVTIVIKSRRFDPFVIRIDQNTGKAMVVNPISSNVLDGNEALARYFIKKYVIARETYNPVDFDSDVRKTIRLFSTGGIFMQYIGYIRNKDIDPTVKYNTKNTTFLIEKSWSKLSAKKYMFRFSINETAGDKKVYNKISVVDFDYVPMELTDSDKDINPVGFQVMGYRVDDDNS